jgi:hypothetical protein
MMENRRVVLMKSVRVTAALLLTASIGGCAQTVVQPQYEQRTAGPVARPSQVLVYDFAVSAADVSENQGFFAAVRNSLSDTSEYAREMTIAREVQSRMSEELVAKIRDLGLPAQRAARGTVLPSGAIAVTGLFLNVDEGNRLQRTVVGFGAGQSTVNTQVEIYAPSSSGPTKLLEFTTHADSGSMPGALVTGGAGAAASGWGYDGRSGGGEYGGQCCEGPPLAGRADDVAQCGSGGGLSLAVFRQPGLDPARESAIGLSNE